MRPTVYLALNDECDVREYPDGLRIEVFLSNETREKWISEQPDFGDWDTREVELRG